MTILLPIIMIAVAIGLPLAYALRLWRLDEASLAAWLLAFVEAAMIVALVALVARWDIAGYYSRLPALAAFLLAAGLSLARHRRRPWDWQAIFRQHRHTIVSAALVLAALAYVAAGLMPSQRRVDLSFPLAGGRFIVGQGGGNLLLNHHHDHRQQRYAADITALNAWGFRAAGPMPRDLDRYAIFGAAVVSPCDGRVAAVVDGLPDLTPPESDADNPAGNHVAIDCGHATVELAHLRRGSVAVSEGENIETGKLVGRVGNSGNTTEPHLHIHAYDTETGRGVEMAFDGRRPVRNRLFAR